MPKSAVIVANGTPPRPAILRRELECADFILAADGGANHLITVGIEPHAVIGDFDSIDTALPGAIPRIHAPDQNRTDLEKAVNYCRTEGYGAITLIAATGDRLDHTFAALALVCKYSLRLVDDRGEAVCVRGPGQLTLAIEPVRTVSLMPCGPVKGLTTKGLKWDLQGADFSFAERDGTSNVAGCSPVEVSVESGYLLVYTHHASDEQY